MPANTNPQVIAFCNQKVRTVNDLALSLYYSIQLFQQEWTQQGIAALIPNDSNVISDGSPADGRHERSGAHHPGEPANDHECVQREHEPDSEPGARGGVSSGVDHLR